MHLAPPEDHPSTCLIARRVIGSKGQMIEQSAMQLHLSLSNSPRQQTEAVFCRIFVYLSFCTCIFVFLYSHICLFVLAYLLTMREWAICDILFLSAAAPSLRFIAMKLKTDWPRLCSMKCCPELARNMELCIFKLKMPRCIGNFNTSWQNEVLTHTTNHKYAYAL